MDTNVFNNIAPAAHVSKRRELPINEMVQAAQSMEDRYQSNKATMDKLSMWSSNVDVGAGDEYLKQQTLASVNGTIESIAGNEGAYENSSNVISGLAKQVAGDYKLNKAIGNQKEKRVWERWADEQKAAGKHVYNLGEDGFRTENEDGTVNNYKNTFEVGLDHPKKMNEVWDTYLHEENLGQAPPKLEDIDPDNPFVTIYGSKGIGNDQVLLKKAAAFEHYRQTDEYAQQQRVLMAKQGLSKGEADQHIATQFDDTGTAKQHSSQQNRVTGNPLFTTPYQKGALATKKAAAAAKKAEEDAKYNTAPIISQGISQVAETVTSIQGGNKSIRDAKDPEAAVRQEYCMNNSLRSFITANPEIQTKYNVVLDGIKGHSQQMQDFLLKETGLRGGGDIDHAYSKNSLSMKRALGIAPEYSFSDGSVGTTVGAGVPVGSFESTYKTPEKFTVAGEEYTIKERKELFKSYQDIVDFKSSTDFDDNFEEQASELQLTDNTILPGDPKVVRELEFFLQRQDPSDYEIIPLNHPGAYADTKAVQKAIGSFDGIRLMGTTQGSDNNMPEVEIKDKNGASYRLISKGSNGQDFHSRLIEGLGNAGETIASNYRHAKTVIPPSGLKIGEHTVYMNKAGDYELDATVGSIIKDIEANASPEQYTKSVTELYANSLGGAFDQETFNYWVAHQDSDLGEVSTLYGGVSDKFFNTKSKALALDYANYIKK